MMLSAIKNLVLARYQYIKGDEGALALATQTLKDLHALDWSKPIPKQHLEFALETYDTIKSNTKVNSYEQIDYITSKVSSLLLLPLPKCGLPTIDLWDTDPWTDPEFPPQPGWKRVAEIPEILEINPNFEMLRENEVLVQAKHGEDCSLVCTMISIYSYQHHFLADLLYPKRVGRTPLGTPQYTPSGHYVVKLLIGGVWRMVEIDDYIPWDEKKIIQTKRGSLLPILLEKAYLKTMGGYDFRGSNAALDTFQLSAGVPLFYDLQNNNFEVNRLSFDLLFDAFTSHRALVCLGTGCNAPSQLERNHDFAVVSMSCENKILEVVNPLSETPEKFTWAQVQELFHILYLNHSPLEYNHTHKFNEVLPARLGFSPRYITHDFPQYVVSNPSNEPQECLFTATIKPTSQKVSAVLQLRAFDTINRLSFSSQAPIIAETLEVEALCLSLKVTLGPGAQTTVVASFHDLISGFDTVALHIQTSSKHPLEVQKLKKVSGLKLHRGEFSALSGRYGTPHYFLNPSFVLDVRTRCNELRVFLAAEEQPCHLVVFRYSGRDLGPDDQVVTSGPYAAGLQFAVMYNVQPGRYLVVASLYKYSTMVPFQVSCVGQGEYRFEPLPRAKSGYFEQSLRGQKSVSSVRVASERPSRIVVYISENCVASVSEAVVDGTLDIGVLWRFGDEFEIYVYSEFPVKLET